MRLCNGFSFSQYNELNTRINYIGKCLNDIYKKLDKIEVKLNEKKD